MTWEDFVTAHLAVSALTAQESLVGCTVNAYGQLDKKGRSQIRKSFEKVVSESVERARQGLKSYKDVRNNLLKKLGRSG